MYRISVPTEKSRYDLAELAKMFMADTSFQFVCRDDSELVSQEHVGLETDGTTDLLIPDEGSKNDHKRLLYRFLSGETGKTLDWGILTGVRPEKLYRETADKYGEETADRAMIDDYYVSDGKLALLKKIYAVQRKVFQNSSPAACGLYAGIPFCPTRCLYCSFTSNVITKPSATAYVKALLKEAAATAGIMERQGLFAESIYIGGGTPTALDEEDLGTVLGAVSRLYGSERLSEFTVEAGRPETITREKLRLIRQHGAGRISINPQSMKQRTLELIGRLHSPQDIIDAFRLAKEAGVPDINADLITGLPEETAADFTDSLRQVIDLAPTDITVHTLAVKRGSRLIEQDEYYSYKRAETVREMLEAAEKLLSEAGYRPYYMYRQKHMAGNFENVGWALPGHESLYNIRIMEENQSIIALGAGGISKMFYPAENRLERIANVSNYQIYIERIDEMINRKEEGIQ